MTQEPDEALRWARANIVDAKLHQPIAHGYRVGQAAAKERIRALQDVLRALIHEVRADGHDGCEDEDGGQSECPICATIEHGERILKGGDA